MIKFLKKLFSELDADVYEYYEIKKIKNFNKNYWQIKNKML